MPLAIVIVSGRLSINGQIYVPKKTTSDPVQIKENDVVDTIGESKFKIHAFTNTDCKSIKPEPYAVVSSIDTWRIALTAPLTSPPENDDQKNHPVSYLLPKTDGFFTQFELQVNEGCVRIGSLWNSTEGHGGGQGV